MTSFYGLSSGRRNSLAVLVEVRCSFFSATMAGLVVPPGLPLKLLDDADEKIANSDESVDADGASDADATSVASIGEKSCASYSVYGDSVISRAGSERWMEEEPEEEEHDEGDAEKAKREKTSSWQFDEIPISTSGLRRKELVELMDADRPPDDDIWQRNPSERESSCLQDTYSKPDEAMHYQNVSETLGNSGWGYCNMGEMKARTEKTQAFEVIMKRHPGTILCFAEAGQMTEDLFRSEGVPGLTESELIDLGHKDKGHILKRPSFKYLTIRGSEKSSLMIAARHDLTDEFSCLAWKKMNDGEYRRPHSQQRCRAYTRMMVCEIKLRCSVGHLGRKQVIMNVHLHHKTANQVFGTKKLEEAFETMANLIHEHGVNVLMGDFNMALTVVTSRLAERNVKAELGAWFPWKSLDGRPMMDSTGIFFVNLPGKHSLYIGLNDLHAADDTGFLSTSSEKKLKTCHDGNWCRIAQNAGPGFSVESFLPKPRSTRAKRNQKGNPARGHNAIVAESKAKLEAMMKPTDDSRALINQLESGDKTHQHVLHTMEKRLFFHLWHLPEHSSQRGSHYPLWTVTTNKSRRSPEGLQYRKRREAERKASRLGRPSSWPQHDLDDGQKWRDENTQWQRGNSNSRWQQAGNDWQASSGYADAYDQRSHGRAKNAPAGRAKWSAVKNNHDSKTAQVAMADTTRQKANDVSHEMNIAQRSAQRTNFEAKTKNTDQPDKPADAGSDSCVLDDYVPSVDPPAGPRVVPPAASLGEVTHKNFIFVSADSQGNETWMTNTVWSNGMSWQTQQWVDEDGCTVMVTKTNGPQDVRLQAHFT